ncbi:hypothetical protein GC194_05365 [bacterium]|nr:hypothetical protein [bacterium]
MHWLQFKTRLSRLIRFEFWPVYVFYAPFLVYWLWLGIKAKNPAFLFKLNPIMPLGGAIGSNKYQVLQHFNPQYVPVSALVNGRFTMDDLQHIIEKVGMTFPMVAKPNKGERGFGVEVIANFEMLETYLRCKDYDIILQEFIEYPIELGVLYHKCPLSGHGAISSVVQKKLLHVEGDGKNNLKNLIERNERACNRKDYLLNKYKTLLETVPAKGEMLCIEPIGNHCRGTTFINGQALITEKLISVFDTICAGMEGFDYGRFDIKVKSIDDLLRGQNIKILELNGLNSEPAHIYHPGTKLFDAYREVKKHFDIIFNIYRIKYSEQESGSSLGSVLKCIYTHIQYTSQ